MQQYGVIHANQIVVNKNLASNFGPLGSPNFMVWMVFTGDHFVLTVIFVFGRSGLFVLNCDSKFANPPTHPNHCH